MGREVNPSRVVSPLSGLGRSDTRRSQSQMGKVEIIFVRSSAHHNFPDDIGRVVNAQLHHFSDASVKGYG